MTKKVALRDLTVFFAGRDDGTCRRRLDSLSGFYLSARLKNMRGSLNKNLPVNVRLAIERSFDTVFIFCLYIYICWREVFCFIEHINLAEIGSGIPMKEVVAETAKRSRVASGIYKCSHYITTEFASRNPVGKQQLVHVGLGEPFRRYSPTKKK
ncbi:hypothetical protein F4809DRAFT_625218 [Biscogniauxia mediterranea]|nr:hypothetical protein F4809DRAFT_625218 [Biscogniauxia mediterranea]